MRAIPVIDLSPAREGARGAQAVARRIGRAWDDTGFFQVTGHGIPSLLFDDVFAVTRRFFALPAEARARVAQPAPDQVRGWSGVGSEGITYSLDEESPADLKEKMDIGPPAPAADPGPGPGPDLASDPGPGAGPHLAPNLWPAELPGMRPLWEDCYHHLARMAGELLRLSVQALGLPTSLVDERLHREVSMLRGLWYPDQPQPPLPGQMRAGVHSDYGTLTLVAAEDRPGGLQVLDRDGEWIDVPVAAGALTVMVGDLLAEWTGDRWPATLHRVVNPRRERAMDSSRLALAFYQHPDHDSAVEVLPGLPGARPADPSAAAPGGRVGVLTAGEHLREKYLRQTTFGSP